MQYPKGLAMCEHAPGRKLAEITVQLKNVRRALTKCAKAVADIDVDVLSGFDTVNSSSRVGYFSFFADVTDTRSDLKALEKKLKSLSVVEGVEVLALTMGSWSTDNTSR